MTVSSKLLPKLHEISSCGDVFHPWAPKCSTAVAVLWWNSFRSCCRFFTALYLLQFLLKRTKDYQFLIKCYLGSILHCSLSGCVFVSSNCLARNLLKRFHPFWIGFGCGATAGLPIFLEHPSRRNILNITYFNMVLDMIFRELDQKGFTFLTESLRLRIFLFMIINSILLYKLQNDSKHQSSTLWFFTPSQNSMQEIQPKTKCYHDDACWKNIGKTTILYFALGTGIQFAKTLLYSRKLTLPKMSDMGFPVFAASYVSLFKATTCAIYRRKQKQSPSHAILGGFVSGTALYFYPSRSIFLAALGNLIKILAKDFKESQQLPNLPYLEISYLIFNGLLYNSRILRPEVCPNFFIFIINLVTNKRAQWIYSSFEQKCNELIKSDLKIT